MNRTLMGLGVAAALLPLAVAPSALAALDPPLPTPATVLFHTPIAGSQNTSLGGSLCQAPNTCVSVPYVPFVQFPFFPIFSTGTNVDLIENAVKTTPGEKILYGYSGAAQTVTEWLRAHAGDADAPPPEDLTVVLLANPSRKYGGINAPGSVTPVTQYHVVDVTRQYDYNSDYPTDRFNLLASANIAAGFFYVHLDYSNVDLNDPNNIVWTEDNTTYVFVPTKNIPLLEPLRRIGLTQLADQLNDPLKARIEEAYDRSYLPAATPQPVADTTPTAPVVSTMTTPALVSSPSAGSRSAFAPLSPPPVIAASDSDLPATNTEELSSAGTTIEPSTSKPKPNLPKLNFPKLTFPKLNTPKLGVKVEPSKPKVPAADENENTPRTVAGGQATGNPGGGGQVSNGTTPENEGAAKDKPSSDGV